jgi:hypothetical protein
VWGIGMCQVGSVTALVAVKVGSQMSTLIFPSSTQTFPTALAANGAQPQGAFVGIVQAGYIQTTATAAIPSGSQTVTPILGTTNVGITTSTPLTIDVPGSNIQEVVTPSAIGANSNTFTATFAFAHAAGTFISGVQKTPGASIIAVPGAGTYSGMWTVFINP